MSWSEIGTIASEHLRLYSHKILYKQISFGFGRQSTDSVLNTQLDRAHDLVRSDPLIGGLTFIVDSPMSQFSVFIR